MHSTKRHRIGLSLVLVSSLALAGCGGSYRTPGGPANFRALNITPEQLEAQTDYGISERMDRKPLASFPAAIAVVRVQDRRYASRTARGYGHGSFSVVTTRDVETDEHLATLQALPMVRGIATLNRLVLPSQLESDLDLRQAAAQVQADMLLIYTFDTTFTTDSKLPPASLVTLGLFPEREARVTSTASAALMDTRNGYIYGLAESTAHRERLANAWTSDVAVDVERRRAEEEAFNGLVAELTTLWPSIVATYGPAEQPIVN